MHVVRFHNCLAYRFGKLGKVLSVVITAPCEKGSVTCKKGYIYMEDFIPGCLNPGRNSTVFT